MRRAALLIATLLAASQLGGCSKCSVPTFGSQVCEEKPAVR